MMAARPLQDHGVISADGMDDTSQCQRQREILRCCCRLVCWQGKALRSSTSAQPADHHRNDMSRLWVIRQVRGLPRGGVWKTIETGHKLSACQDRTVASGYSSAAFFMVAASIRQGSDLLAAACRIHPPALACVPDQIYCAPLAAT